MKEQDWIEEGWFYHNHAWHLLHEIIKQIPKDTENLLDYGAGTGIAAAIINAIFPKISIIVTDIEKECIKFWEDRNLGYLTKDISDIVYNNFFDVVISSHVLEHIENPKQAIKEMFRVCKKRMILAVPDGDCHFYDHKIIFNRTIFKDMIYEALEDEEFYFNSFPVYHPHINNLITVIGK